MTHSLTCHKVPGIILASTQIQLLHELLGKWHLLLTLVLDYNSESILY